MDGPVPIELAASKMRVPPLMVMLPLFRGGTGIWNHCALATPTPSRCGGRARESWTELQRGAGAWQRVEQEQHGIWVVAGDLDVCDGATLRDIGHLRWKIENNAFGELPQPWHLTHCSHHHPTAVAEAPRLAARESEGDALSQRQEAVPRAPRTDTRQKSKLRPIRELRPALRNRWGGRKILCQLSHVT